MKTQSEISIGINVGKIDNNDRGITVYTKNILSELGLENTDNVRVVLLHYPGKAPQVNIDLNNVTSQPFPFMDNRKPIRTILDEQIISPIYQKTIGLDVVWQPHNRGQLISLTGYICTVHDILPVSRPDLAGKYLNNVPKKILYASRTLTIPNADVVITPSEFTKAEIIKHLRVDEKKIHVIPYGIDQNLFRPLDKSSYAGIRGKYALPDRYVLTIGSYAPHKNLKFMVDAYGKSDLHKDGIRLVMVGPNNAAGYRVGYNDLQSYINKSGLSNMVLTLPSIIGEDLVAVYNASMAYVTASLYEGFGLTPLEAMACRIPIIAPNTTATPEVCGDSVLYADPTDVDDYAFCFNEIIRNKQLAFKLLEAGFKRVQSFSWKSAAESTFNTLVDVALKRR